MPSRYGKWEMIGPLREGGQAHTYLVKDIEAEGDGGFVLKRLKNPKRNGRFKAEIEALNKIDSPFVVKVIDFDLEAKEPYFVAPYMPGGSLQDFLESHPPFNLVEGLLLFKDICEGVMAAHGQNVIHRDLKPDNIFLSEDGLTATVGDFGLCFDSDGERQTILDEAVGARLYMAPEHEDGRTEEVGARSDIYSLGKILWRLFSGRQAFPREGHRNGPLNLVERTGNPQFERINRLLDRMITHDPSERFSGVHILLERVTDTIRLVEGNYNVVGHLEQRCIYCGEGYYKLVANSMTENRNAGITPAGATVYKIFACNACGNTQLFNPSHANKAEEWWGAKDAGR